MRGFFACHARVSRLLVGMSFLLLLLAGIFLLPATMYAATGTAVFSIQPTFFPHLNARPRAYFIYNSTPATIVQDSVTVKNVGTMRGTVTLYPVDALTAQSSGTSFADPTRSQHDVGAWITLRLQRVTLNPGQSVDIPFLVRIPQQVRPGQHGGGILAESPNRLVQSTQSGPRNALLHFQNQEILGMLINLPGPYIHRLNATGITYDTRSTYQRVLIALHNTGTQLLHPTGSLQISDVVGKHLKRMPLNLDTFLPQTSIEYPAYIQQTALQPGTYTAQLHLLYEGYHQLNYETRFVVPFPTNNSKIGHVAYDLATLNAGGIGSLPLLDYIIGGCIIFLALSALYFWGRQAFCSIRKFKR